MQQPQRRKDDTNIALIQQDIKYLVKEVDIIREKMEKDYVTQDQFDPVRKIVYGLVAMILVAVVTAIMTFVIK